MLSPTRRARDSIVPVSVETTLLQRKWMLSQPLSVRQPRRTRQAQWAKSLITCARRERRPFGGSRWTCNYRFYVTILQKVNYLVGFFETFVIVYFYRWTCLGIRLNQLFKKKTFAFITVASLRHSVNQPANAIINTSHMHNFVQCRTCVACWKKLQYS